MKNDTQFYLSGSESMGYSIIDAKAGMPLCAPKETMEAALMFILDWRLPLSSVMWDSDTLRWVNIKPDNDESPQT